jgi:hypothetical protein
MSVEIPLKQKYLTHKKGTNKSHHNDQGVGGGKKNRAETGAGLQVRSAARVVSQQQTTENQMMLVITATGKRTWVRIKDMKR